MCVYMYIYIYIILLRHGNALTCLLNAFHRRDSHVPVAAGNHKQKQRRKP